MDQKIMMNQWEISTAIDEVAFNVDSKQMDKALESFSEDAAYRIIEEGKAIMDVKGKEPIRAFMGQQLANMDFVFHNNGTKVIDVMSLDQAAIANTSSIIRKKQINPAAEILQFAEIADKLIKVEDYWYIVDRTVNVISKTIS